MPGKKFKNRFKFFTTRSSAIPANIAVGPLSSRAVLDVDPEGERNHPYQDRPDLTMVLGEDAPQPSRIEFHEREGGVQEPPVPGTSAVVATHDTEQGDHPTSECY